MKNFIALLFLVVVFSGFIVACSEDPSPEKSSAKEILSFTFLGLSPEVNGEINETEHTVKGIVPFDTDVTALQPTISISSLASISPASGVVQDFSAPVVYTVTAEDGSSQNYTVTLTEPEIDFTLDPPSWDVTLEPGTYFSLFGSGFLDLESTQATFISVSDDSEIIGDVIFYTEEELYVGNLGAETPLGEYKLVITMGGKSKMMEGVITFLEPGPKIISVDKETIAAGDHLVITGENFLSAGNYVELESSDQKYYELDIVAESETSVEVTIPDDLDPGSYMLYLSVGTRGTLYSNPILVILL